MFFAKRQINRRREIKRERENKDIIQLNETIKTKDSNIMQHKKMRRNENANKRFEGKHFYY